MSPPHAPMLLVSNSYDGGGAYAATTLDTPLNNGYQDCGKPHFRTWTYGAEMAFTGTVVSRNRARCGSCTGGGVAMANGSLVLQGTQVVDNHAILGGGGVAVQGVSTSLHVTASRVGGNTVATGTGVQLFGDAAGPVTIEGSNLHLRPSHRSEVALHRSGRLLFRNTSFSCSRGSDLVPMTYVYNDAVAWEPSWSTECSIQYSALDLQCFACPPSQYSFAHGALVYDDSASGRFRRYSANCALCLFGTQCRGGDAVTANPGYWGVMAPAASAASVGGFQPQLSICPPGYCCSDASQCDAIDACAPGRTGPLCSTCVNGTPVFGGRPGECRALDDCHDTAEAIGLALLAGVLAGVAFNVVFEGVCPRRRRPVGLAKLLAYR